MTDFICFWSIVKSMKIKLLLTGGTIDKQYNELTGEFDYTETHIHEALKQGRCRADVDIEQLMLTDSLDMTDSQRQVVLNACVNAAEDRLVITHGTDTMAQTAELLGVNIHNKVIVLTGAMVPYAFGESDALFNLGSAITAVQILDYGVYVAMNGKIFSWDNVTKNRALGEFQLKQ